MGPNTDPKSDVKRTALKDIFSRINEVISRFQQNMVENITGQI